MQQGERYQITGKLLLICKRISLVLSKAQDPRQPSQLRRWEQPNKEIKEHWTITKLFQIHQTRVEPHMLMLKFASI